MSNERSAAAASPYWVDILESTASGEEVVAATLPLGLSSSPPDAARGLERPVHADRRAWFRIRLNPSVSAEAAAAFALPPEDVFGPRTTVELHINGEVVPSRQNRDGLGAVCLWPADDPAPFMELIGFASVSFWVRPPRSSGAVGENFLYAPPVLVLLPADGTGARLQRMGEFIYEKASSYLGRPQAAAPLGPSSSDGRRQAENAVAERLRLMRAALRVYEMTQGYFHANARFKYAETNEVAPFERLRTLTPASAAWLAERPDEWIPSETAGGIFFGGCWRRPKHVLVQGGRRDHATPENIAVAGFLRRAALDAADIAGRIAALTAKYERPQGGQYVSTMDAVFRARAESLKAAHGEFAQMAEHFERLFGIYVKMLELSPEETPPLSELPPPGPAFASIPAYSMIYERMREWFELPPMALEREEKLLVFSEGPELYEVYVLLRMLDALSACGLAFEGASRWTYPTFKSLAKNTEIENTFHFRSGGVRVTLYYQPIIRGQDASLKNPENGIGLMRTTSFNFATPEKPADVSRPQHAYYMPDYLLKAEVDGRSFYVIADAKLSSAATVLHKRLGELVFKYAFSIAPMRPEDTLAGLHFFCGRMPRETELDLDALDDESRRRYFAEGRSFLVQDIAFGRGIGILPALSLCTLSESASSMVPDASASLPAGAGRTAEQTTEEEGMPFGQDSTPAAGRTAESAYEPLDPEAFMPTAFMHLMKALHLLPPNAAL